MEPNVFALLNVSGVRAFVGTNPLRAYRHGSAPQGVMKPYITWTASAVPENALDDVAKIDEFTVNVTCWSDDEKECKLLAEAIRSAIEPSHHLIAFSAQPRDPDTMRFSYVLTFTFWEHR